MSATTPSPIDALVAALEELETVADGYQTPASEAEDEVLGPKLSLAMSATRHLLAVHRPQPTWRVPLDIAVLERALRNWPQPPPLDADLDHARTRTRANIRVVRAGLLAALEDLLPTARRAFAWVYRIAEGRRDVTDEDREKIKRALAGLDQFAQRVAGLLGDGATPGFVHQGEMVTFFVKDMTLQIDLARLHLTVNDQHLDVPALVDVIESVGDASDGFRANVIEWGGQVDDRLRTNTEDLTSVVTRVVADILGWAGNIGGLAAPAHIVPEPDDPNWVRIEPGTFLMGIPEEETKDWGFSELDKRARPQHEVTIPRAFLLGKYPVTVSEYAIFARETNRPWNKPDFEQTDRHPAVMVGFDDAVAYAAWLSDRTGHRYRLPTEAEWEYACRAGTTTARYWGNEYDRKRMHVSAIGTAEVGSYLPNPWGLHDMLGNVWEWCADTWHDGYQDAPTDGSAWGASDQGPRVVRGGSWIVDRRYYRSGVRLRFSGDPSSRVGLRLARTL